MLRIYIWSAKIKNKNRGHRSYKKMGAVPKVRIGDKIPFLSRSQTSKTFFARYDSITKIGIHGLQKYDLK